ncbi:MAG TPA: hypothetical protein P5309_09560 [Syntrophomonadaceae bacterium]|jgi:hypothetical protein|nr:hypothetical protein [Syntrophomonadaceae bacterium]
MSEKQLRTIVVFGALWGLCEATLGYLVHMSAISLIFPGLGGFIMFPIGFYFMYQAYRQTGSRGSSIMMVSFLAASIKLIDFLVPGHILATVIMPALSIVLEGLVVFLALRVRQNRTAITWASVIAVCSSWRLLFLLACLSLGPIIGPSALLSNINMFIRFVFVESMVNALLIYIVMYVPKPSTGRTIRPASSSWAYSLAALLLAVVAQLFI